MTRRGEGAQRLLSERLRPLYLSSDEIARICDAVAAQHQFRGRSHRLIISGLCVDCRSNRSKSRHQDRA